MKGIKVKKEVAEQMASKLQANKNVFVRGDFDDYKINDEELKEHDADILEKSHLYRDKKWMNGHWVYRYSEKTSGVKFIRHRHGLSDNKGKKLFFNLNPDNYNLIEYYANGSHDFVFVNKQDENERIPAWQALKIDHKEYLLRKDLREDFKNKMSKYKNTMFSNNKIPFRFSQKSIDKLTCDKAINKSNLNGFSTKEHFEAASKIKELVESVDDFKKYPDRKGKADIAAIYRGNTPVQLSTRKGMAYITIKEYKVSGKLVYSVELMLKKYPSLKSKGFKGQRLNKAFQLQSNNQSGHNPLPNEIIPQNPNLSSKFVQKSTYPDYSGESKMNQTFDINITDITENNKQQKLEQFSKALTAIADNRPFVIKHIPADNSKNYGNLMVRIRDFDRSKIEKAVHKVALSLDADISGASKGESFVYESQKELAERFFKDFTDKTRAVYNFVIGYFDLPDIRIVSKAGELKHKGKVLYNPTTGLPIKEADWKRFVAELEKFLNKTYAGMGGKIVLSAESLGIILDRLSKTNTLEAIRKMKLSEIKAKRYDVDWISDSVKNMKDKFGESISRERQARIQIAVDSAAQRVVRVQDDMRNNIRQIVIDGIRDKQSKSVVAQNLFDKCASLNRDMQRIADTEIQMAANSAYIQEEVYNSKPDEKVYFKRFEMLDDSTCKKCRKLKGTIALWSDVPLPDERIRDEYAKYAIWDGKNEGDCPVGVVHPWCYSDDTEVMTNNGWKLFKDVEKNDKIMSINPETREIDFVSFVKQVQYEYNGKMIHFPGRNFDLLVTPDHNMLYLARNGHGERKLKEMKACDLIKNTAFDLPRAIGEWKQTDAKTVKFVDLTISKAQYFRLWAWYLAEGSGRCRNGAYEVKLAQKDPMKIYNDLPELQSVLHVYSDSVCLLGDYARYFECMFGIYAEKKFVPPFIKNSSAENIREFLDAFVMADGSKFVNKKCSSDKAYSDVRNEQVLRTSSKKMADDLCELIVKAGWMPSEYVVKEKGTLKSFRNGDYVLNTDCHNISICHSKTRTYAPDIDGHLPRHKPTEVDYKGIVYDVELERWHFLLVRRNGKCAWSGNCRGSWIRYYPNV